MRLLDLFCGAGGAAMGYHRAGFTEIVGVDIEPQPDYPFDFVRADALAPPVDLSDFDLIHASPPCQRYSALTTGTNGSIAEHADLVGATRAMLSGRHYVIENVAGAPIRKDLTLCGEQFGLGVIRHRYFELGSWSAEPMPHVRHRGRVRGWRHGEYFDGPYRAVHGDGGGKGTIAEWQEAMGIGWTSDRRSLAEAIPPAYTKYIGSQFVRVAV